MKRQKAIPVSMKKNAAKATEWKVVEFSAFLEEAAKRYDRATDACERKDRLIKDDRLEKAKKRLPSRGKKDDLRQLH